MKHVRWLTVFVVVALSVQDVWARREILSTEQKALRKSIQVIVPDVLALTNSGAADAGQLTAVIIRRLSEVGYRVATDSAQPHDVVFRVKCEQTKKWEGTMASGGDADLPDSPSRVWKGPACQFRYAIKGKSSDWRKEVRTSFADSLAAAAEANAKDAGTFALAALTRRLEEYDFPVRLMTEWRQEDRLLRVLDAPETTPERKVLIIKALGELLSDQAVPRLQSAVKDPDPTIGKAAAISLGEIGSKESITTLVDALHSTDRDLQIAAARGLGKLGALHGDTSIVPPLLEALHTDDITFKTEVVWALGKVPDKRAYEPLRALQRSLRGMRTSDRNSPEGKLWDAVNYSIKQIDYSDQIN